MKLYIDEGLAVEVVNFEDNHSRVKNYVLLKKVIVDIRQEGGKISFNLDFGDMIEYNYRKQTAHEILRIYCGNEKFNYIFEIEKAQIVNIEEVKE